MDIKKTIFYLFALILFYCIPTITMENSLQELSPDELHTKLCVLNGIWHQQQTGLTHAQRIEAQSKPFDLQKINEPTEENMTPFVGALNHWQTDDKPFLRYLMQNGADISNPQIICTAVNSARFGLIPWLMENGVPLDPQVTGNFVGLRSIFSAMICSLHNRMLVIEQDKTLGMENKKNQMNRMIQECILVMKLFISKGRSLDEHQGSWNPPLLLAGKWGFIPITQFLLESKVSLFYGKKQNKRVIDYLKTTARDQLLCISDRDACIRLIESKEMINPNPVSQPTLLEKLSNLLITK